MRPLYDRVSAIVPSVLVELTRWRWVPDVIKLELRSDSGHLQRFDRKTRWTWGIVQQLVASSRT